VTKRRKGESERRREGEGEKRRNGEGESRRNGEAGRLIPEDPPTPEATAWQAEDRGQMTDDSPFPSSAIALLRRMERTRAKEDGLEKSKC
jgi:hypothetical protein